MDYLNFKLWIVCGHTASFKIEVLNVQDFWIFELSPIYSMLGHQQPASETSFK